MDYATLVQGFPQPKPCVLWDPASLGLLTFFATYTLRILQSCKLWVAPFSQPIPCVFGFETLFATYTLRILDHLRKLATTFQRFTTSGGLRVRGAPPEKTSAGPPNVS